MVLTCYDFNHMKCMHALHGDAHPLGVPVKPMDSVHVSLTPGVALNAASLKDQ